jgi:hypothetical protein
MRSYTDAYTQRDSNWFVGDIMSKEQSIKSVNNISNMRLFVMPESLALALRSYLVSKPYEEVYEMINALDSLNAAVITDNRPAPESIEEPNNRPTPESADQ